MIKRFITMLAIVGSILFTGTSAQAVAPQWGVYEGPCNTAGVTSYTNWLGAAPAFVSDTLDMSTWANLEQPSWWTSCWAGKNLVLGVPLIPSQDGGTIQQGATGAYNSHFLTLAQNLVAQGQAHARLRLGWEFNGDWYPWSAASDPAAFVSYWQQIVTTMRSVAGQSFVFVWNPTVDVTVMTQPELAYPGNTYVTQIGLDIYDQSWAPNTYPYGGSLTNLQRQTNAWSDIKSGRSRDLDYWVSFASSHAKPLVVPEWGLALRSDGHGGADNPYFINSFVTWATNNSIKYANYFDANGPYDSRLRQPWDPNATAKYKLLVGP